MRTLLSSCQAEPVAPPHLPDLTSPMRSVTAAKTPGSGRSLRAAPLSHSSAAPKTRNDTPRRWRSSNDSWRPTSSTPKCPARPSPASAHAPSRCRSTPDAITHPQRCNSARASACSSGGGWRSARASRTARWAGVSSTQDMVGTVPGGGDRFAYVPGSHRRQETTHPGLPEQRSTRTPRHFSPRQELEVSGDRGNHEGFMNCHAKRTSL